jgi:hypothetical protein
MGRKYEQLSLEDRCTIARLQAEGRSIRHIAAAVDRAPSTVSREIDRNRGREVGYQPGYAQQQAKARRWVGSRLEREPTLRRAVLERLAEGWSPEQVAGRFAREAGRKVISYESIYRFFYARSPAPRTIAGGTICLAPRASAGCVAAAAAAPQGSLKAVFPWLNGHPLRPSARPRAIGKPTRSCSQNTGRPRSPCLSGEHGSSWRPGRATEPPSVWHSISFGCLRQCRKSCARPSPSTTAASSPAIASCTGSRSAPTSVTRTHPGRRVAWRTQSAGCVAFFLARPISQPCRTSISGRRSAPTTTPRASALTSGPRLKPSPKCCTSNVNPPARVRGHERNSGNAIPYPAPPTNPRTDRRGARGRTTGAPSRR